MGLQEPPLVTAGIISRKDNLPAPADILGKIAESYLGI
jgi:hypothetical protein